MTREEDNLRYWYEHELCRLRAAERAGFSVAKELAELTRLLDKLPPDALPKISAKLDVYEHELIRPGKLPTDWTTP